MFRPVNQGTKIQKVLAKICTLSIIEEPRMGNLNVTRKGFS